MPQKPHKAVRKGTYILVFDLPDINIEIGKLGLFHFSKGTYCYVGSAMNGLDQRIARHISTEKKVHWHIDHLTILCEKICAYETQIPECDLARIVSEYGGECTANGFGCSDCKCVTHLFLLDAKTRKKLCSDKRLTPHSQCNGGA